MIKLVKFIELVIWQFPQKLLINTSEVCLTPVCPVYRGDWCYVSHSANIVELLVRWDKCFPRKSSMFFWKMILTLKFMMGNLFQEER